MQLLGSSDSAGEIFKSNLRVGLHLMVRNKATSLHCSIMVVKTLIKCFEHGYLVYSPVQMCSRLLMQLEETMTLAEKK